MADLAADGGLVGVSPEASRGSLGYGVEVGIVLGVCAFSELISSGAYRGEAYGEVILVQQAGEKRASITRVLRVSRRSFYHRNLLAHNYGNYLYYRSSQCFLQGISGIKYSFLASLQLFP